MQIYKYGPLVYNVDGYEGGNFYWNGLSPVGYDHDEIPVDRNGMQCLPISSPLHPSWTPRKQEFNQIVGRDMPTIQEVREWFEEHFLDISDYQICKYILKWYVRQNYRDQAYHDLLKKANSIEEVIKLIWPHVQKS